MSSRHVILPKSRGINPSRFPAAFPRVTPLFATLTRHSLTISKHATLTLLFATLTKTSRVSPLLATLTKNTGSGGNLHTLLVIALRYLLTPFLPSNYTLYSFSREEPCT